MSMKDQILPCGNTKKQDMLLPNFQRVTLNQPSTRECGLGLRKVVGHMSPCVTWRVQGQKLCCAQIVSLAVPKSHIDTRDPVTVGGRPNDGRPISLFQLQVATRVVPVVMRVENVCQLQSSAFWMC